MPKKSALTIDDVLSSPDDPTPLFDLIEELAVGSYGHVYKAIYRPTKEVCALKIIKLEEDDTFEEMMIEIQILVQCSHRNIVGYVGSWKKGDELFIAMELCDGGSATDLYQILEEPLPEREIALVTKESLEALVYLHDMNIIHRDIKASNILLTSDGVVKLTDFGVSAQMESPKHKRRTFIGTPYWIAPEVVNTVIAPYGVEADIWSMGITMIELAEMAPPLHQIAPMTAVLQIPKNDPPELLRKSLWSDDFHDILRLMLTKDPARRPSARELLEHPFCKNVDKAGIIKRVREAREAEEAYLREHGSDDMSDEYSDEDEPTYQSASSVDSVGSGYAGTAATGYGSSRPMHPPPPTPAPASPLRSSSTMPTAPAGPPTVPSSSGVGMGAGPAAGGKPVVYGTIQNRPTQASRPEVAKHTLKKENQQDNVMAKKMVKRQVNELKKLMKAHEMAVTKQTKVHNRGNDALEKKFQTRMNQMHRKFAAKRKNLISKHEGELSRVSRNNNKAEGVLQKKATQGRKDHTRNHAKAKSKQESEFRAAAKSRDTQWRTDVKKKKVGKKEKKALEADHKRVQEMFSLKFQEKITIEGKRAETDLVVEELKAKMELERTSLFAVHTTSLNNARAMMEFKLNVHLQNCELTEELQSAQLEMERKQLMESHELQRANVVEHHALITDQTQKTNEANTDFELAKFLDGQKAELSKKRKEFKAKKMNRKEKKKAAQEFKKWQSDQEGQFMKFMKKKEEMAAEQLRAQQLEQMEVLGVQHKEAKDRLTKEHAERLEWLKKKHTTEHSNLEKSLFAEYLEQLRQQHQAMLALTNKQDEEAHERLDALQKDERDALRTLHKAQSALEGRTTASEEHVSAREELLEGQRQVRDGLTAHFGEVLDAIKTKQGMELDDNMTLMPASSTPQGGSRKSGSGVYGSGRRSPSPNPGRRNRDGLTADTKVVEMQQRMTMRLEVGDAEYMELMSTISGPDPDAQGREYQI